MFSYCTEKTTEFSLIPAFSNILNIIGENVPVQYWKTREGNQTSKYMNGSEKVYLIAFFARRPKVEMIKNTDIQGKINNYVFEFNAVAKKNLVPVFCGIPLATDIFQLRNADNMWFHIPDDSPENYEVIFNISNGEYKSIYDPLNIIKPTDNESVCGIIENKCEAISWSAATERMTQLNLRERNIPWYIRGWRYKPVFFLIRKHN